MNSEHFQQTTTAGRAAYWLNAAAETRKFAGRAWGDVRRFEIARAKAYVETARGVIRQSGNFYQCDSCADRDEGGLW